MINLSVNINEKEIHYPIYINNSDLNKLKKIILDEINHKNYIVIFSKKVYKLYSKILDFPKEKTLILPDGEHQKNHTNLTKILNFALSKNLKREDSIIAIGGGVIGDITGFAASIYMRGINFIQVPTTLLAATDSSVGGKTAINTKFGKNLIGSFYQPKAVFINVNFLKTLDEKQFKSGLGEVLKYGFIEKSCTPEKDSHLINYLSEHHEKILNKDILTLKELIKMCIELKIAVVQQDEKESGLRKILNYGHTYGHVVENLTNYRKYTHGECVIEGINFALKLAQNLNLISKEYKFLCEDLIKKYEYKPLQKFDKNKILKIIKTDKKSDNEYIKFILATDYATVKEFDFTIKELDEYLTI
uniref:3-dehydroquinate synthase n=1 Tax=uncultured Candidatus Melainabacteria bacterium TaxID=2682970 RepID=A0A650EKB8_9BACT|nr:3-dehydroquinate synthase [uncultured Candidatus Melainabacteria bacterium]